MPTYWLVHAAASLMLAPTASGASAGPPDRAWAAQATTRSSVENLSFEGSGAVLKGTLHLPHGTSKVPAVIVLHAASSPSRDEALYAHLLEMLPALGIAVLTYDRRGTGASTGDEKGNGFDVLVEDGIAAAKTVARHKRIDPSRIGFWGLSQGGWLSLLAATRHKQTAFAISVSAPMVTPDVQMNFAVANILRIKGHSDADIAQAIDARTAVDEFQRGRLDRASAQNRLDAAVNKPWFNLIYLDRTFSDPDKSGWAKEIRHDPLQSIGAVTAPALILYGAVDPWVPVQTSVERLKPFVSAHPNFSLYVINRADHAMMSGASPTRQIDPASFPSQAPDSAEYFAILAAWLQKNVLDR